MVSPSQSYTFTSTGLAHSSSIFFDVGVNGIVGMPLRTVSFLSLQFRKLQSQLTSPTVFLMGNSLKVFRVHTSVVPAKMVKFQANWYIAYKELISKSMGTNTFPLIGLNIKRTISRLKTSTHPNPATIFSVLINLVPKSIFNIHNTIIPRITTEDKELV